MQDEFELDYDEDDFNDSAVLPSAPPAAADLPHQEAEPTPAPLPPADEPVAAQYPTEPEEAEAPAVAKDETDAARAGASEGGEPKEVAEAGDGEGGGSQGSPSGGAGGGHDKSRDKHGNLLPPGWVSKVSSTLGDVYYRNIITNTSSWEIPTWPADTSPPTTNSANHNSNTDSDRNGEP